jgi:hypothetical protein
MYKVNMVKVWKKLWKNVWKTSLIRVRLLPWLAKLGQVKLINPMLQL